MTRSEVQVPDRPPIKIYAFMGYRIQAIIGQRVALQPFKNLTHVKIIDVLNGYSLIPVTTDLYTEIVSKFQPRLLDSESLFVQNMPLDELAALVIAPIAYIEAEYFGGTGTQYAVSFGIKNSRKIYSSQSAINLALRDIGYKIHNSASHDEFEDIGLKRHRDTEDWIYEQ